jgi:hypothetical protein
VGGQAEVSLQEDRKKFNAQTAPRLAKRVGFSKRWTGHGSERFAYFFDDERLAVVAGPQEGSQVDLAFARGLEQRGSRRLVLILPEDHAFATLQRAPWFRADARPEVYLHDGVTTHGCDLPTRDETVRRLAAKHEGSPEVELRKATTPAYLGACSDAVYDLVEWATKEPLLDAGHRRGERSWHCMGQKVLSIKGTTIGLAITAGIHYGKTADAPIPVAINKGESLEPAQLAAIKTRVVEGIRARLIGSPPIHRPDEHWLQAVIRRDPSLVGVEQPALRELPAWRPAGDGNAQSWGRGYIDLLGVDGHGDIRVVETKLSGNTDDLLVCQGLDYYIWAQAYRRILIDRLGAPDRAVFEIHYVIGDTTDGRIHRSSYLPTQARSLDSAVRWRFQTVHNWFGRPAKPGSPSSKLFPAGEWP